MVKELLKGFVGLTVAAPLAGAAISGIGGALTGSLAGIGSATQSLVGVGLLGKAAKLSKSLFK